MLVKSTEVGSLALQIGRPIVCVDIFDTLVTRTIHPEDVKRVWAERLGMLHGAHELGGLLYRLRSGAERALCLASSERYDELEFNYHDFKLFFHRYAASTLPGCDPDALRFGRLMEDLEISVETQVLRRDDKVCEAIEELRANGKRIIGISDFYLPGSMLSLLLSKLGVRDLLDSLFVSCDHMLTKRSGRLYGFVSHSLGEPASNMIMIGDNPHSDGTSAEAKGLAPLVIDRTAQVKTYATLHSEHGTRAAAEREFECLRLEKLNGTDPGQPFEEFALTLLLFTRRLHREVLKYGFKDLHFLSREGKFLKAAFDVFQQKIHDDPSYNLTTHYVYLSRRSTLPGILLPLQQESFGTLFRQYRQLSPLMFLRTIGFEEDAAKGLCGELGIDPEVIEDDFPGSAVFARIRYDPRFGEAYERLRTVLRPLLHRYLGQAFYSDGPIAVVDVGWKGTIQDHLRCAIEPQREIVGFYCGLTEPGMLAVGNRKVPLLFSYWRDLAAARTTFGAVRQLFEALLIADHGSVSGYSERLGRVEPLLDTKLEEQEMFAIHAGPIQRRLLALIERLAASSIVTSLSDAELEAWAEDAHMRIVERPTDGEVTWYRSQQFYENFGRIETRSLTDAGKGKRLSTLWRYVRDKPSFEAQSEEWLAAKMSLDGVPLVNALRAHANRRERASNERRLRRQNQELSAKLHEYAVGMERMTTLLLGHENTLRNQTKMIEDRWAIMQNMDTMISERDKSIDAQARMLEMRQVIVQDLEAALSERDALVAGQASALSDLRVRLAELSDQTGTQSASVAVPEPSPPPRPPEQFVPSVALPAPKIPLLKASVSAQIAWPQEPGARQSES
jgi:FMN phosphatase YigB (HAD superfamily)